MARVDMFASLDATAQAELVRKRAVKPIELVDSAIERIERLNPAINAVITPMFEQARSTAKSKLPKGPFTGVPFLLKDLTACYAGVRMTSGSAFMRDFVPDHDSELVIRLKRAGLIIVGKTNTPEFGILPTTEPRLFGPSRNPWDPSKTTGGSSGGSAAAVAARMVPMAHGNDGGGSLRVPASCCGVFGLKPTRARNPVGPDHGELLGGLAAEHALTISVRDSAALLDATSGPDVGDPYWASTPVRPFLKEVNANAGRLRIALTTKAPTGIEMHPDCVKAVTEAGMLCTDLGHKVEEVTYFTEGDDEVLTQAFLTMTWSHRACQIDESALKIGRTPTPDQFEPLTWAINDSGRKYSAITYIKAVKVLQRASREIGRFFESYDVWLSPTLFQPPVALGTFDSPPENPMQGLIQMASFYSFPALCNFTGQPGMSVPLYWNSKSLPIGTHFVARFGDEATLFRLAAQLETAQPWAARKPLVSA